MMRVGVLFSGGKDSCLALHKAKFEGHEIACLLSVYPENSDSFMFHKPDLGLLKRQAEELGAKLIVLKIKGEKDKEVDELRNLIEQNKKEIAGLVIGGIASNYQYTRIKKICDSLGLKLIAPLLGYSPEKVWKELFADGFKVSLTKIACEGIGREWLGRVIDKTEFGKLKGLSEKHKFRLDFEGGEAESAVLFMPEFKRDIRIEFDVESEGEYRHFLRIKKVF